MRGLDEKVANEHFAYLVNLLILLLFCDQASGILETGVNLVEKK